MRELVVASRALLLDLASTLLFLALYALSGNIVFSIVAGIVLAIGQIAWRLARHQKPDALQWISLLLVAGSGSVSLLTRDPVFVMLKPTAIYLLVGLAMLQRGWMARYMPPRVMQFLPDLVILFGYVWAGLMFFSALLNLALAARENVLIWGSAMASWGIASKATLFVTQYLVMRWIGRRRRMARVGAPSAAIAATR
jgi:intracellular septation protein